MQLNKALINPVQIYWYLFPLFIRVSPVLYLSTCKFTTSDALLTLPIVLVSPMTFVVSCFTLGRTSKNFKFNKSHHKPAETFRKTKALNVTGLIVNAKKDIQ